MIKLELDGIIGLDVTARDVREKLSKAKKDDIEIRVSSPGGSVYQGIAIYNELRDYRRNGGRISARVVGLAASMASYIPLAADTVEIEDNAVFMIHNPWTIAAGNQNDMRKAADELDSLAVVLAKAYTDKTGKSAADIRKMMDEESFFYGSEIINAGFADSMTEAGEGADDKAEAFAFAKTHVEGMKAEMQKNPEINGLDKAVALCNTPAVAGENKTEVRKMTFQELISEDPAARAEAVELGNTARQVGRDESKAVAEKMEPILMGDYPEAVKKHAMEAVKGNASMDVALAAVAAYDAATEGKKMEAAKDETDEAPETPAASASPVSTDGKVRSDADVLAASDLIKNYL